MSGGSYDYLYFKVEEGALKLLDSYEEVQAMLQRLQGLEYASEVAKETEKVLEDLNILRQIPETELELKLASIEARILAKSRKLALVWRAIEWWDSGDCLEKKVKKAITEFQAE